MRIFLAAALIACGLSGVAHAGDKPLYAPAPGWVKPAPAIDATHLTDADPSEVVMDQQTRINKGQIWAYTDRATRVLSTETMNEIGTVTLPWQPQDGELIIHRAEILRGAQRIDLLAAGQKFSVLHREEQLEELQLDGILTATLAVEGLRVGDVLRLTYSVTSEDPALKGNVQAVLPLMADPERAKFARARLLWPAGTELKWKAYADGVSPKVETTGGFNEVDVALPLAKPAELPGDAPARYRPMSIVEVSSFADWAAVSRTMAPLFRTEGVIAPGSALAAEVSKIEAKSSDPLVRTALALRLVQDEIRYLFRSMNDGNYVPQKPADTWSLRFGDCKAKTMLLLAMLRAMGIESEAVLANTETGDMLAQRLPSAGAFNHVFVRATVGGKTLWLDGTGGGTRIEDLTDTPPFRSVLPVREQGSDLLPIAMHAPARPMMDFSVDIDQTAGLGLPSPFTAVVKIHGAMAEMLRTAAAQAGKDQQAEMAQGFVGGMLGDPLIGERAITYDAETATATLTASGIYTSPWKWVDDRYRSTIDKTLNSVSFAPDRGRPAWQNIPVATPTGVSASYRMRIHLPEQGKGFVVEGSQTLPPTLAGVAVARKTSMADGWISLEDRVDFIGAEIAPADVPAVREQVALAKTKVLEAVAPVGYAPLWKQVQTDRGTPAFAPILAAYAKAIADEPDKAIGYINRAAFHAGVFDWKSAISDLDHAITIEPSAELYLRRANFRRALGDDKAALIDVEAARKLDPGSNGALAALASLKLRTGDIDGALALVRERIAQSGQGKEHRSLVILQAELLGDAGRVAESLAALDAAMTTSPGDSELLNERCWLKGTRNTALDTALKDCTRALELAQNPAAIYDSRAMVYFRMNRLEEARADLDAALGANPNLPASLFMRGVVRKRSGDKGAEEDLAAARLTWPRVDEDYKRYGIAP